MDSPTHLPDHSSKSTAPAPPGIVNRPAVDCPVARPRINLTEFESGQTAAEIRRSLEKSPPSV